MSTQTPALRFLERGKQLNRLQGRVLSQMISATTAEQSAFAGLKIATPDDVQKLIAMVNVALPTSHERFSDIDLMHQMFLGRHVDNFQIFLEELILIIASAHPGLISGVKIGKKFDNSSESEKFERRIDQIGRMSIRELEDFTRSDMDFELLPDPTRRVSVERASDVRNLIIHNYGIIDKAFITRYGDSSLVIGQPFVFELDFIKTAWEALIAASGDIEKRARRQFKIQL